jgi:dTDP-4-dehydrorhamnose 3,5-epimerase-like enzyme
MAYTIELQTITDSTARLTVIEKTLPFEIKRVYYLYDISEHAIRGRHAHRKAVSALISLNGTCVVKVFGSGEQRFVLDRPNVCLVCLPEDWHEISEFSESTVLLVLSSEYYDPTDYIYEKPE